ncbi:hypothetical protein D5S17_31635 [Pseudonocardiaceae bacterium YIM PH 21723]|nr:hypothetical protein D5S17_31635 [Pseudonocardiaceae bacterium YIM PH 21723]
MTVISQEGTAALRPPRHRVDPRAKLGWTLGAVIGWVIVLAGLLLWAGLSEDLDGVAGLVCLLALLIAIAHILVMPQWRYRVHRWEVTETAVYTCDGWLHQTWRVAPISRIQTVDTERGPVQQLLGLSTVTVTTASSAGAMKIAGLNHRTATTLVDELTAITQATPGDAT